LVEVVEHLHGSLKGAAHERERLTQKRKRLLKLYRDGYLEDKEFSSEMATVELALQALEAPVGDTVSVEEVLVAGKQMPELAALWQVATVQERREMIMLLLEPGGLLYDLQEQRIIALRPRPAFLPTLRLLDRIVEDQDTPGLLVVTA
jgi:site-specific DNA recombinase